MRTGMPGQGKVSSAACDFVSMTVIEPASCLPAPARPRPLRCLPLRPCSPFDSSRGRLALGLAAASGGGIIITTLMQSATEPKTQQALQLLLVFW